MSIARGVGGNRRLFEHLKEYELEKKEISEKYNHQAFHWYRRLHAALMISAPFSEAKPAKTWDEFYELKKEKTKEKLMKIEDKSHNLAHRLDRKMMKSKTFGSLWKKVTGAKEDLDSENC